jgi:hypothetical protein
MGGKSANKAGYFDKLKGLLEEYKSIFIVEIDNVSSQQMHEIRHALRGKGVVLMGKNTMVCGCDFPFSLAVGKNMRLSLRCAPIYAIRLIQYGLC